MKVKPETVETLVARLIDALDIMIDTAIAAAMDLDDEALKAQLTADKNTTQECIIRLLMCIDYADETPSEGQPA